MSEHDPDEYFKEQRNPHDNTGQQASKGGPLAPRDGSLPEEPRTVYLPARPLPHPSPPGDPPRRPHRGLAITLLVMTSLVLILAGAVAGLMLARSGSPAPQTTSAAAPATQSASPSPSSSPSPSPSDSETPAAGETPEITPPTAEPSTNGPSNTTTPVLQSSKEVLRQGKITISRGYCVNLETIAPDWEVGRCQSDSDLHVGYSHLETVNDIDASVMPSNAKPSRDACATATNFYKSYNLKSLPLRAPVNLCVRVTGMRYSWVRITDARESDNNLTEVDLEVITWTAQRT